MKHNKAIDNEEYELEKKNVRFLLINAQFKAE